MLFIFDLYFFKTLNVIVLLLVLLDFVFLTVTLTVYVPAAVGFHLAILFDE